MTDHLSIDSLKPAAAPSPSSGDGGSSAPGPIRFTDKAASKVTQLAPAESPAASIGADSENGAILRVYIQGGGCSGFQYGFSFEHAVAEDDMVVDNGPVKLVVDPMSFQYLMGAEVDYKEDLEGARFVINNPNASTTCGCGSSFNV